MSTQILTAIIVVVCVIAGVVLTALHDTVPTYISGIAVGALGGHLVAWVPKAPGP